MTEEKKTVLLINFLDAVSKYYAYFGGTTCGIPEIILEGKHSDWKLLVTATEDLSIHFQDDLGPFFKNLLEVLRKIEKILQ